MINEETKIKIEKAKEFIGCKFEKRISARNSRLCEVVDVRFTFNSCFELVDVKFVSVHDFSGQKIYDYEVPKATITRGLVK